MPKLIDLKLHFPGPREPHYQGELGPEHFVTGHHSAGRPDSTDAEAIGAACRYHAEHAAKGWGGLGYHYIISRRGSILLGRPTRLKGAHVGLHNSNNVGVMCLGTVGDKPTIRQRRALRWLLENAHTYRLPSEHRTDLPLADASWLGHNDWSGHESNACPGTHKRMYLSRGTAR